MTSHDVTWFYMISSFVVRCFMFWYIMLCCAICFSSVASRIGALCPAPNFAIHSDEVGTCGLKLSPAKCSPVQKGSRAWSRRAACNSSCLLLFARPGRQPFSCFFLVNQAFLAAAGHFLAGSTIIPEMRPINNIIYCYDLAWCYMILYDF